MGVQEISTEASVWLLGLACCAGVNPRFAGITIAATGSHYSVINEFCSFSVPSRQLNVRDDPSREANSSSA
jgi:hypothetical protein